MNNSRKRIFFYNSALVFFSASLIFGTSAARAQQLRSPHSAEACLDCHKNIYSEGGDNGGIPSIIIPEGDDPHRVLISQCIGCHPENIPPFWIVIFPGQKSEMETPKAVSIPTGKPSFENPHDSMECDDCHVNKVSFNSLTGREKELVETVGDVSDFCRRCHDEIIDQHFPRKNIPGGQTTCLSCHNIHYPSSVPPALRDDYYTYIRKTLDVNPHGGSPFCLTCHPNKPLEGELADLLFGNKEMSRLCSRCHIRADHHIIDVPSGNRTQKMDFVNYPLQEGQITCVTCHEPHGGDISVEGGSKYSLRGEPYERMVDFCMKCHEEGSWKKINPHDQLTMDGSIINKSCLFCHINVPDTSGNYYASPEDFNDSYTAICSFCHDPTPHPTINHILQPSREKQASIQAYEIRRDVILPLDFDGRVTCVTCHNPHEKGLISGPAGIGADEENKLRLTTFNEICTPCHGRH